MTFGIVWASSAARAFRRLPGDVRQRIAARVNGLATDRMPPDAKPLRAPRAG